MPFSINLRKILAVVALALAAVVGLNVAPSFADGGGGVSSTAYCDNGTMANGNTTHAGAVAMNGVPFGTKYKVTSGPLAGQVLTVEDRIGHSSDFDVWLSSCDAAINYGRQSISIEQVGPGATSSDVDNGSPSSNDKTPSTPATPSNPDEQQPKDNAPEPQYNNSGSDTSGSSQSSSGDTYTVQPGDTLSEIACNNGTTYQDLAQKNGIAAPYLIYPGQVLQL